MLLDLQVQCVWWKERVRREREKGERGSTTILIPRPTHVCREREIRGKERRATQTHCDDSMFATFIHVFTLWLHTLCIQYYMLLGFEVLRAI